jgi:hypothetical protein
MPRPLDWSLLALALAACSDNTAPDAYDLTESAGQPIPRVTTFGVTPIASSEGDVTVAAINDAGQVAGTLNGIESRAFIWENGAFALAVPPGARATAINSSGSLAGSIEEGTSAYPAAWEGGLGGIDLSIPAEASGGFASAINDNGMIAGRIHYPLSPEELYVWADGSDAAPTLLDSPGSLPQILSFSSRGRLVGASEFGKNDTRALFWPDRFSAARELKGFDGGPCLGTARSINEHDEIVGGCSPSTTEPMLPAYWPDPDAVPIKVGGDVPGVAASINELGQIVGRSGSAPTLWTREGESFRGFTIGTPGDGATAVSVNNRGGAIGAGPGFPAPAYLWHIPVAARVVVAASGGKAIKLDRKGAVVLTIFGSHWFRTADIDPATLTLGNDDGLETAATRKKGKPVARSTDANGDGFMDLVVEFDERELVDHSDLVAGQALVYLLGRFRDGTHIRGAAPLDL